MIEVFKIFLKLGLTSFGGPIAHLSYFRSELVQKRRWLSEAQFAQLLALCQFLPGPASSQLGFSLGLIRAGFLGAIAAFTAFTLPSAISLICFANALPLIPNSIKGPGIHGLKLVALVIVAHGLYGMSKKLCPDIQRRIIAVISVVFLLYFTTAWSQIFIVLGGAIASLIFCKKLEDLENLDIPILYGKKTGLILIASFFVLLALLPLAFGNGNMYMKICDVFYRAGALVFGGGHVVLPLLEQSIVETGWLSSDKFLAGYGATQAVPGPMFSFSSYLGTSVFSGQAGLLGAFIALISVFFPGFILLSGILPFWRTISSLPKAKQAIAGVNASVVGLLAAALYNPIWTSSVKNSSDLIIAALGLLFIQKYNAPSILIIAWCVTASFAVSFISTL